MNCLKSKSIIILMFFLFLPLKAEGIVKNLAEGYCAITHPVEMFNNIRHDNTCEEQHVIQKQQEGSNKENISLIPVSSHISTDSWGGKGVWWQFKVWENNISKNDPWGMTENSEKELWQAYKLGRWQLEYVFLLYNYRSDKWHTTLFNWNGMAHLVYTISWWVNLPSKYLRKTAYLLDKKYYKLLVDQIIQIPILLVEGVIGFYYNIAGIFIGAFLHPIDTLASIIGGIWLIIKAIIGGIIDLFLTLFLLFKSII